MTNESFVDRLMSIGKTLEVLPEPAQYYLLGVAETLRVKFKTEDKE